MSKCKRCKAILLGITSTCELCGGAAEFLILLPETSDVLLPTIKGWICAEDQAVN